MKLKQITFNRILNLFYYNIISLPLNIIYLIRSLKYLIRSFSRPNSYKMFSEKNALLYYYYDSHAYLLKKYGRNVDLNFISNKPFFLGKWFFISKPSIFIFYFNNAFTILVSIGILLLLFFLLYFNLSLNFFLLIVTFFFSSKIIHQIRYQNYNIIGWSFFPLLIYGINSQDYIVLSIVGVLFFETSITVFFVGLIYLFTFMLIEDLNPLNILYASVPSIVLILLRIYPLFKKNILLRTFSIILNAIGFLKQRKDTFVRPNKTMSENIYDTLVTLSLILFSIVYYFENKVFPVFFIVAILVHVFNKFKRFADPESTDMLLIISGFYEISENLSLSIIIVSWFLIFNPFIDFLIDKNINELKSGKLKPLKIDTMNRHINNFIKNLNKGDRVFFVYNDPNKDYNKLFNYHNRLIDPIYYHCILKEVLFFSLSF